MTNTILVAVLRYTLLQHIGHDGGVFIIRHLHVPMRGQS